MTKQNLYLLSEAARALGCKPYIITYALATKQVPEPRKIGGRRTFTKSELKTLAKKLGLTCNLDQERGGNGI